MNDYRPLPDNMLDHIMEVPCDHCDAQGEIAWLPTGAPGMPMNNPYTMYGTCPECDGEGVTLKFESDA